MVIKTQTIDEHIEKIQIQHKNGRIDLVIRLEDNSLRVTGNQIRVGADQLDADEKEFLEDLIAEAE